MGERFYEAIVVFSDEGGCDVLIPPHNDGLLAFAEEEGLEEFCLGTFKEPPWTEFPGEHALIAWIVEEVTEGRGSYLCYNRSPKGFRPWVITSVGSLGNDAA